MFVDLVNITVKAGNGGDGAATFLRNAKTPKGGPDGGNGGNGGNIYFIGSHNISDLSQFRFQKKIVALNGISGKQKKMHGKNAEHKTVPIPVGTQITDETSRNIIKVSDTKTLILIAKGGKGGLGNTEFKSATNQTPLTAERGTVG